MSEDRVLWPPNQCYNKLACFSGLPTFLVSTHTTSSDRFRFSFSSLDAQNFHSRLEIEKIGTACIFRGPEKNDENYAARSPGRRVPSSFLDIVPFSGSSRAVVVGRRRRGPSYCLIFVARWSVDAHNYFCLQMFAWTYPRAYTIDYCSHDRTDRMPYLLFPRQN